MKERGFLAYQHEVKAILNGRQIQFRRAIKPQPHGVHYTCTERPTYLNNNPNAGILHNGGRWAFDRLESHPRGKAFWSTHFSCPYGIPGDKLWVRETFFIESFGAGVAQVVYLADGARGDPRGISDKKLPNRTGKVPSIHMPRHMARLILEVKSIRVERVQEISEDDAELEGIDCYDYEDSITGDVHQAYMCRSFQGDRPTEVFKQLWDSINAKRGYSWEKNPWVWVVEFEQTKKKK